MTRLYNLLQSWTTAKNYTTASGGIFLCHWPTEGALAYLHKLYAPLERNAIPQLQDRIGFTLPSTYLEFLSDHNGARLFLGTISLNGLLETVFRSVDIEKAQPVSLIDGLEEFRSTATDRWHAGWREIGNLTVNNRWSVQLSERGSIAVVGDHSQRLFSDIWHFLSTTIEVLTPSFSSKGFQLHDWDEVDQRLAEVLGTTHSPEKTMH